MDLLLKYSMDKSTRFHLDVFWPLWALFSIGMCSSANNDCYMHDAIAHMLPADIISYDKENENTIKLM